MRIRGIGGAGDHALRVGAGLVVLSVFVTALHDVSYAFDVWYYHLPFAARIAGIVPPSAFVFHDLNQARFDGLPLFGELLQGVAWRITGRPECASLVSFACVPLFAWFLRWRFRVPVHLSLLALLAIPLVQTHATSCYVDLLANTAASVVVLLAVEAVVTKGRRSTSALLVAMAAAAIAVNTKVLAQPTVVIALGVLAIRTVPSLLRDVRAPATRVAAVRLLSAALLALPIVFFSPLKNVALHGNPFFPVRMSLLGHALPGVEAPYSSSPPWLEHVPEPVRFVVSVLEVGVRPMTDTRRWTVDQWMPADSTGNRMGGFFGAYALVLVALLVLRAVRDRGQTARRIVVAFAAFTAVIALMPQAHELRYYMDWMIVLVGVNLWLACLSEEGSAPTGALGPRGIGIVAVIALALVVGVTRGAYVLPMGSTFTELVESHVDARSLSTIGEGERVCVRREPWNILWAAPFHAPRTYVVKDAEESDDCAGYRLLE